MNGRRSIEHGHATDLSQVLTSSKGGTVAGSFLLTVEEVADLLRTSAKAIYALVERGQVEGVVRLGRRVLFRRDVLLQWVCQKSTPSQEVKR